MFDVDTETLRKRYEEEKPLYEEFTGYVQKLLESELRQQGISFIIQSRVKETDSFLKKAIRGKYISPFDQIRDKAGVRVIVTYYDTLSDVVKIINELFTICHSEDKKLGLNVDQLGYLGIHFEISLSVDPFKSKREKYQTMICEIQLHTHAQNLWANISHELLYKPLRDPPESIKRSLHRLLALVELFDSEVKNAKQIMSNQTLPREVKLLNLLERKFYHFTTRPFDRELSLEIIASLQQSFENNEIENFSTILDSFISVNEEKIIEIFADYSNDKRCNPLLFQPESFLIFERLEKNQFSLKKVWMQAFPLSLLESLATIWGMSV